MYVLLDITDAVLQRTLLKGSKERHTYDAHACETKLFIFGLFAILTTLTEGKF